MTDLEESGENPFLTEQRRPRYGSFWVFYLFFRPRRFFEVFEQTVTWFSTLYASLLVGIASVIDRFSIKVVQYQVTGRPQIPDILLESWAAYWAFCIGLGCVGAAIYYAIGGWWYRVRLKWAGAVEPDRRIARQVYIFATLITALPVVVLTGLDAVRFPTPLAAENEGGSAWLAVVALLFYSVYVSYRGVRTVFGTVRWKAVIWFLVLPCCVYVVSLAAAIGLTVAALLADDNEQIREWVSGEASNDSDGLDNDDPLQGTQKLDFAPFAVEVPPWWFPQGLGDVNHREFEILIDAPGNSSGYVEFLFRVAGDTDEDATTATVRAYTAGSTTTLVRQFATWGRYEGAGVELSYVAQDNHRSIRVFTTHADRRRLTIVEDWPEEDAAKLKSGFELIRRTFRLKD